ncbi:hypothetical protein M3Y95_01266100 [Aphelenchoides besseyi]|nr:hypothetical protein M3Y95_01266100 [Aphelenchoides besseyi]
MLVALFFFLVVPFAQSVLFPFPPFFFGPKAPTIFFSGRITHNGKDVPALVSVEILYKSGDKEVPLSVVQANSLANYHIGVSGLLLQDPKLLHTAYIRVQSLSTDGGSKVVKFEMDDEKFEYKHDIELGRKHKDRYINLDDDTEESNYRQ